MTAVTEPVLSRMIDRLGKSHGDLPAIDTEDGSVSFREVARERDARLRSLEPLRGLRIGVQLPPSSSWIAALGALDALGCPALLLPPDLADERLAETCARMQLAAVIASTGVVEREGRVAVTESSEATVTLLTSGTTGVPKAVTHSWKSLTGPTRIDARFVGSRWLSGYPIHLYAGLQVFAQCFTNAGTLVVVSPTATPAAVCRRLRSARVEYAAGTASYWRRLLSFGDAAAMREAPLKQITLGGETATDDVLSALRACLPSARIAHIYATSELGRCFSVTDGRAGFPAEWLASDPEPGTQLRVVDGELHVRSANRMLGYDPRSGISARADDWFATGDVVEVIGDRVVFRGRRSDLINVGGNKVSAIEVEGAIRQVPGVADVRVYPAPSSLVGELVAADVVPEPGYAHDALRKDVLLHCGRSLSAPQRPRQLRIVEQLDLTAGGKIVRRKA